MQRHTEFKKKKKKLGDPSLCPSPIIIQVKEKDITTFHKARKQTFLNEVGYNVCACIECTKQEFLMCLSILWIIY